MCVVDMNMVWKDRAVSWAHTHTTISQNRKEGEREGSLKRLSQGKTRGAAVRRGEMRVVLKCVCVCVHAWRGRGGSPVSELHSFGPSHWCVFQTGGYVKGNRIFVLSMSLSHTHTHTQTGKQFVSFPWRTRSSGVCSAILVCIWRAVCLSRWVGPRTPSSFTLFILFLSSHVLSSRSWLFIHFLFLSYSLFIAFQPMCRLHRHHFG